MINTKLKEEMEQAFLKEHYDKALELSKRLDVQIVEEIKKTHSFRSKQCYNSNKQRLASL